MFHAEFDNFSEIPLEAVRHIDRICDEFEELWQQGGRPQIGDFLGRMPAEFDRPPIRAMLFRSLLAVELELSDRFRSTATEEEYLSTFPDFRGQIEEAFAERHASRGLPGPLPCEFGNYVLLEVLGTGGMGCVYKARHQKMQRLVALKTISPEIMGSGSSAVRFQQEIHALAQLSHPHIAIAYDAGTIQEAHFLVMEFIDGIDLEEVVRRQGPLSWQQAVETICQAAEALRYAHSHGIIHRDVKPANLMLNSEQVVKLLDLGLSRLGTANHPGRSEPGRITQSCTLLGTPDFMAPEQALDIRTADERADIYSLGCTFYYLLTGRAPYKADTLLKKALEHRDAPIPPLEVDRIGAPSELELIFRKMVAKKPEDRYQSMGELLSDLAPFSEKRRSGAAEVFPRQFKRSGRRWQRPVWGAIALAGLLVTWGLLFRADSQPEALPETVNGAPSESVGSADPQGELKLYVWSRHSDVYHDPDCWVVKRIHPENRDEGPDPPHYLRKHDCRTSSDVPTSGDDDSSEGANFSAWKPTPQQQAFLDATYFLDPEQQVQAVSEKLKSINSEFDGDLQYQIEGDRVVAVDLSEAPVEQIWPLAALTSLESLNISATRVDDLSSLRGLPLRELLCLNTSITDLAPLAGMPLKELNCAHTLISDLFPLKGMQLQGFNCGFSQVEDLSPLRGMPLSGLLFYETRISDLSPVRGMPLHYLNGGGAPVSDLSPLEGLPINILILSRTDISDLSPLEGMPLINVKFGSTRVTDLTPLKGMKLKELDCSGTAIKDLSILEGMPLTFLKCNSILAFDLTPLKTMPLETLWCDVPLFDQHVESLVRSLSLKTLNGGWVHRLPVEEFWKDFHARREAAETFATEMSQLPADEQIAAIERALRERNGGAVRELEPVVEQDSIIALMLVLEDDSHDITPLRALSQLQRLTLRGGVPWLDLSPLKSLPLEELACREEVAYRNLPTFREIRTLKTINGQPVEDYLNGLLSAATFPSRNVRYSLTRPTDPQYRRFEDRVDQPGSVVQLISE